MDKNPISKEDYGSVAGWQDQGQCVWTTNPTLANPLLLKINAEAREVILDRFEAISVSQNTLYVDLKRSTVLLSRLSWSCLTDMLTGRVQNHPVPA